LQERAVFAFQEFFCLTTVLLQRRPERRNRPGSSRSDPAKEHRHDLRQFYRRRRSQ
jgi:hypothetical protein